MHRPGLSERRRHRPRDHVLWVGRIPLPGEAGIGEEQSCHECCPDLGHLQGTKEQVQLRCQAGRIRRDNG